MIILMSTTDDEKMTHYPNKETIKGIEVKKKFIIDTYNANRDQWRTYIEECNNLKIVKQYFTKEDLLTDNNKIIFVDKQYDTTIKDLDLYKTIIKKNKINPNEEFMEIMKTTYLFDTLDEVNNKYNYAITAFNDPDDNNSKRRKVVPGDLCILNINSKKYLYKRRGLDWIAIDKQTFVNMPKCYNYDTDILDLEI